MGKKQEIAKTEPEVLTKATAPTTLDELFTSEHVVMAIQKAAPKHLSAERFLRMANTAMTKTPKLMKCTVSSVWDCLIQLSGMGLEPDGRRAHLIPFGTECTLVVDYKGIVDCVRRSGEVSDIHADVVCENDEYEENMSRVIKHRINRKKDRGDPYAAYSYVKFKDGTESFEIMGKDEIEAVRDQSAAWKAFVKSKKLCPWNNHPGEMWKKTVFKRHSKWLPFSSEMRHFIEAEDAHQFPGFAKDSISGDDIKGMADGSRKKIQPPPPIKDAETEDPPIHLGQVKALYETAIAAGWEKSALLEKVLQSKYNIASAEEIPTSLYDEIVEDVKKGPKREPGEEG